jgi:hypothetical protein
MYVCATGAKAKTTTLEKTKQWFLFVPVSKPTAVARPDSYANRVLLAAQADAIRTRAKKVAKQRKSFHRRLARRGRGSGKSKIKTVTGGTFYIIPCVGEYAYRYLPSGRANRMPLLSAVCSTDHLLDRASALTGGRITTRGVRNTQLKSWKKGDKSQQWKVLRVR